MKLTSVLSWIVILIIAIGLPTMNALNDRKPATTQPSDQGETIDLQYAMAGKYSFAASRFQSSTKEQMVLQLDVASKTPIQKVATAVVVAEVSGKEAAITRLTQIDSPDATILRAWYESQTPIPEETLTRLDWFGKLAQTFGQPDSTPDRGAVLKSANTTLGVLFGAAGIIGTAGVVGFGLFITAIVLIALGKMRFRVGTPVGPTHVYAEAFALYLSSYILGAIVVSAWFADAGLGMHMVPLVIGVLVALMWPVLRGVKFSTQRADWGIHTGSNIFLEAIWGVLGYLAGLPIVALAAVITIVLVRISDAAPTHPIMSEIADHPWLIVLLAVVFAPLTEELLFRGAFVSHLRGSVGIVLSSLISGFIFAAIHPQGWTLIPVLMSIGVVMALIRQWRDTLVSSITAHALHNGTLVTMMLLLMKA